MLKLDSSRRYDAVRVQTVTCAQLIKQFGLPEYIKATCSRCLSNLLQPVSLPAEPNTSALRALRWTSREPIACASRASLR